MNLTTLPSVTYVGKLYQRYEVEFDGESNGDGHQAQKPHLDPIWTPYGPHMGRKMKI